MPALGGPGEGPKGPLSAGRQAGRSSEHSATALVEGS